MMALGITAGMVYPQALFLHELHSLPSLVLGCFWELRERSENLAKSFKDWSHGLVLSFGGRARGKSFLEKLTAWAK